MREPVRTIRQLWERLVFARINPRKHIRFGLYSNEGGLIGGHAQNTGLCCDMWNMRHQIEAAVRLAAALEQNPEFFIKLHVAGCTCMTKTHEWKYHKPDCVYGASRALEESLKEQYATQ